MNIVLIARSEDKLKEVAKEIETNYKVQTKVIVIDFGSRDNSIYNKLEKDIEGLNITMLINNVGIMTQYPKFFHETPSEEIDNIVYININTINHMTRLILPQMRTRKFGTIINLSSASAYIGQPTPLFAAYAGTKAYIQKFSMSLYHEVKREGIEVLAVTPFYVTSKMSRTRNTNLFICSEKTQAEETLNKIGYNMQTVVPWINHFLQLVITTYVPFMQQISMNKIFSIRKYSLKKIADKQSTEEKKHN